jgi:hypothetical protein
MKTIGFLTTTVICFSAFAGGGGVGDGGGGVGVRCSDPSGASTIELLDIHEGRILGLAYEYSPQTNEEVANLAAKLFVSHFSEPVTHVQQMVQLFQWNMFLPAMRAEPFQILGIDFLNIWRNEGSATVSRVQSLNLSSDIGRVHIRPGCQLEQVAFFDDRTNILFLAENWNELDGLSKAAILLHEVIYLKNRHVGLEYAGTITPVYMTSERSRQLVGALLSTRGLLPRMAGVPEFDWIRCFSSFGGEHVTSIFFYPSGPKSLVAVVDQVSGYSSAFSARAEFQISYDEFWGTESAFDIKAPLQFYGEINAPAFNFEIHKTRGKAPATSLLRVGGTPIEYSKLLICNRSQKNGGIIVH